MEFILSLTSQFSGLIYYFLSFLLIISIIVFVHEYGHYIVAKICRVKIKSFSIGFGPEVFGFNDRSGTRWKLSAFPLGGYVKMLGDANEAGMPSNNKELSEEERLYSFHTKPRYKKAAIVFAGPFANIVLAVVTFTLLFSVKGYNKVPPVIGSIIKGSAADQVGLLADDIITHINGRKVRYFEDISRIVARNLDTQLQIDYKRTNVAKKVLVTPSMISDQDYFGNPIQKKSIGIVSVKITELGRLSIFESIYLAVDTTYNTMCLTIKSVAQMVVGQRSLKEIGGPIRVVEYSGQSVKKGVAVVLHFIAFFSINLAVINLLPIPMLDGGHLFNYAIEAVVRRDLSPKYYKYTAIIGFLSLFSFMAIGTLNDSAYLCNKLHWKWCSFLSK